MSTKIVSLRLPEDLYAWLKIEADEQDITVTALIFMTLQQERERECLNKDNQEILAILARHHAEAVYGCECEDIEPL